MISIPNDSFTVCLFKMTFRTILSFAKRLLDLISKETQLLIMMISIEKQYTLSSYLIVN
jgi:hypothetical protein